MRTRVPEFCHITVPHAREVGGIGGQEVVGGTALLSLPSSKQKALRREEGGWAEGKGEGEGAGEVKGWEREGRVGRRGWESEGEEGGERGKGRRQREGEEGKGNRNRVRKTTGRRIEEGERTKHSSL